MGRSCLVLLYEIDEGDERLFDIDPGFGRSFEEWDFPRFGHLPSVLNRDLAFFLEIALVPDENHREFGLLLDLQDLFSQLTYRLKAAAGGNTVY